MPQQPIPQQSMPQHPPPSHIHTLGADQRCTRCGWDGTRIRPGDTLRLNRRLTRDGKRVPTPAASVLPARLARS